MCSSRPPSAHMECSISDCVAAENQGSGEDGQDSNTVYTALPEFHMRLLHILPGEWEDDLCGRLITVPLEGKGIYYEAVSYCWEIPNREHELRLPCGLMKITSTCRDAIRRFRYRDRQRTVWIDQVCINQDDNQEKSAQVRLMRSIYRNASRVLIYLGEPDSDIEAFSSLKRKPWFRRIWAVQELAVSRAAVVVFGVATAPWQSIVDMESDESLVTGGTGSVLSETIADTRPDIFSYAAGSAPLRSFLRQLLQTRHCEATDPRDKIFAVLGLLGEDELRHYDSIIDYSLTLEEVNYGTAVSIMQAEESLRLLSFIQTHSPDSKQSWVPDWTQPLYDTIGLDPLNEPFDAGGRPFSATVCDDCLYARGVYVDILQRMSKTVGGDDCAGTLHFSTSLDNVTLADLSAEWEPFLKSNLEANSGSFAKYLSSMESKEHRQGLKEHVEEFLYILTQFPSAGTVETWASQGESRYYRERKPSNPPDREYFLTAQGFMGLAPRGLQPGDILCILLGGPTPYILRPSGCEFTFIGECYVFGLMNGEALAHLRDELAQLGHVSAPHSYMPCLGQPLRDFAIR